MNKRVEAKKRGGRRWIRSKEDRREKRERREQNNSDYMMHIIE